MSPDRRPERAEDRFDHALVEAAGVLWQLPFIATTAWWNLMVAPYLPECPRHPHYDAHDLLVVPEPLEEAGERALFA